MLKIIGIFMQFLKKLKSFEYYGDLDPTYDCLTDKLCYISIIDIYEFYKLEKYGNYNK